MEGVGRDVEGWQGETSGRTGIIGGGHAGGTGNDQEFFHLPLNFLPRCFLSPDCPTLHDPCPDIHVTGSSESTPMVSLTQDLRPLSLVMGSCWSVLPQLTPQQPWV